MPKASLDKKLEQFKQLGTYGVQCFYGEGIGCDDNDIPAKERTFVVLGTPVGCLGECRIMFKGTVESFKTADLKKRPVKLSNPPTTDEMKEPGYYIWGTDSVDSILKNPFHGKWKD